jgi:hypothetical protein
MYVVTCILVSQGAKTFIKKNRDTARDRTCGARAVVWSIHRTTAPYGLVLNLVLPGIVSGTKLDRTCVTRVVR